MPPNRQNSATVDSEPGALNWLRRRTTTSSSLINTQGSSQDEPQLFVETYYAYADLQWEKLKKWLEKAFPGHTFTEDYVR
jgi:hypothetical protein